MTWKEKQGDELKREALKHGLAPNEWYDSNGVLREAALQERLRSAKTSRYVQKTWMIALISAIASVVSAIATWVAIIKS